MEELKLVNEAFLIEEFDATLLFLHDLPGLGRAVGETAHVAERHALGAEGPTRLSEVLHREFERHLEITVLRNAVWVLFSSIAVGVHVVPDEVPNKRKAVAEPHYRLVKVVRVVCVDHSVDVCRDAHLWNMAEALHECGPCVGIRRDEVVDLGTVAVEGDVMCSGLSTIS